MKVYHYINIEDWKKMGLEKEEGKDVQLKGSRLGRKNREAWEKICVFALLEPMPENWINNKDFHLTWKTLERDLGGRMLLEIEIGPDLEEDSFVVDRGHVEGVLYNEVPDTKFPDKYRHGGRDVAEAAYLRSSVPLKQYIENEGAYDYSLPEVIITRRIPLDKVKISEQQPLLEKILEESDYEWASRFIARFREVPELNEWYINKMKMKEKVIENIPQIKVR